MAEAKTVQVTRTVTEEGIQLTLTRDEAETLLAVTMLIAGDMQNSRRAHTDNINKALRDSNIPNLTCNTDRILSEVAHNQRIIYFNDTEK